MGYQHNLQSATRAMRDGADKETIVCALFHDVGELLSPRCHGEIAASLLRPYISDKNCWRYSAGDLTVCRRPLMSYPRQRERLAMLNLPDKLQDLPTYL